jgi:hypothetical protein
VGGTWHDVCSRATREALDLAGRSTRIGVGVVHVQRTDVSPDATFLLDCHGDFAEPDVAGALPLWAPGVQSVVVASGPPRWSMTVRVEALGDRVDVATAPPRRSSRARAAD